MECEGFTMKLCRLTLVLVILLALICPLATASDLAEALAADPNTSFEASGKTKKVAWKYWQSSSRHCCRELTLTYPDGRVVTIFDKNDDGFVPNSNKDKVQIMLANGNWIRYENNRITFSEWKRRVMSTPQIHKWSARLLQKFRRTAIETATTREDDQFAARAEIVQTANARVATAE